MKHILVLGAGKSASSLIRYLAEHSASHNWEVTAADLSLELAAAKTGGRPGTLAIAFDISGEVKREEVMKKADIVLSLLPPDLHAIAAAECVRLKKDLVTASYVSPAIAAMDGNAKKQGIILLNETGLDPGIDHMSAMSVIDRLRRKGADIRSFRSYTGGLVAPASNDNPWQYKFTWNPKNVVLAGQGTAQFLRGGKVRYLPHHRLFRETETVDVPGAGTFEAYANRDSLAYIGPYGLKGIDTLLRGTLRYTGFCRAWDVFVQLGWTDDTCMIQNPGGLTYSSLLGSWLPPGKGDIKERLQRFANAGEAEMTKLEWMGLFSDKAVRPEKASIAVILQDLLEEKWALRPGDTDMIVMHHIFDYTLNGTGRRLTSSLIVLGEDSTYTAMSDTVGLPMGIAAKLILERKINVTGVQIPTGKNIYEPVLKELEDSGIRFRETDTVL